MNFTETLLQAERAVVSHVDHTNLNVTATHREIMKLCEEAVDVGAAAVCIQPCNVIYARLWMDAAKKDHEKVPAVCTVIGFPNGYNTTAMKVAEAHEAIKNGADEIDMVINLGLVKEGRWEDVVYEITAVRKVCKGKILKVIVETCLLTENEKIKMCELVSKSGADYIKTSTGFSTGGATREDIALFSKHISGALKIKASGGISTFKDGADLLLLGADRLGTSKLAKMLWETEQALKKDPHCLDDLEQRVSNVADGKQKQNYF